MLSEYGTALSNTLYERQLKLLSVQNTTKKKTTSWLKTCYRLYDTQQVSFNLILFLLQSLKMIFK